MGETEYVGVSYDWRGEAGEQQEGLERRWQGRDQALSLSQLQSRIAKYFQSKV